MNALNDRRLTMPALWTAVITPMLEDGRVDFETLTQLLMRQARAGAGVVLLGSTGEGMNLGSRDREAVVRHACSLGLDLPLMVGVGGIDLAAQLEWIAFCETQPVHAYLLVTPVYAKPGAKGQTAWFKALMDASTRPCMLYHIPGRAAVGLAPEAVEALLGHPRLWAVKESGGQPAQFAASRQRFPQVAWYSGDDAHFPAHAAVGACGLVSVASNVWTEAVAAWVRDGVAGRPVSDVLSEAAESLFVAANPVPVKALMAMLGLLPCDGVRVPLSRDDLQSLEPLRAAHERVMALGLKAAA
jgi:4-hydroxy-tetrahydrodipicolinate synthase